MTFSKNVPRASGGLPVPLGVSRVPSWGPWGHTVSMGGRPPSWGPWGPMGPMWALWGPKGPKRARGAPPGAQGHPQKHGEPPEAPGAFLEKVTF